jgi:hypothetical protein
VTRNGIVQARNGDYTWADGSSQLTFLPKSVPLPGDTVMVKGFVAPKVAP